MKCKVWRCLTGRLLELNLDTAEFLLNYSDHLIDLLGDYGPCTALFVEKGDYVLSEFLASLEQELTLV